MFLVIVFGLAGHFHASSAFHPELAFHLFCAFQPLEGQEAIGKLEILPVAGSPPRGADMRRPRHCAVMC
jgi:hypothetical protein